MRPPGAPEQLQKRRRRAVQLLQAGRPLSAVARQVQASVSSVWRWWQTYQRAGPRGLRPKPTPGRPPRLSGGQQRQLVRILARGPRRAGPTLDRWTFGRVVELFHQELGIRHHPSRIRQALTAQGWRCPRPKRGAVERDEAAIDRWEWDEWPGIKTRYTTWGPSRRPR